MSQSGESDAMLRLPPMILLPLKVSEMPGGGCVGSSCGPSTYISVPFVLKTSIIIYRKSP